MTHRIISGCDHTDNGRFQEQSSEETSAVIANWMLGEAL